MSTHSHSPKIYLQTPQLTHEKCSPTHTYPKYTSACLHPLPPTHKNVQPPHRKCPLSPSHPKYISTHPRSLIKIVHPPLSTQNIPPPTPHLSPPTDKKCPPSPTHPKYTSNHTHIPIRNVHSTTLTQNITSPNSTLP